MNVLLRALIVLVRPYAMAWLTGQMVWVMPMVVASALVAASIKLDDRTVT